MRTAAIVGARGYLGRECARLLLDHPHVEAVVPVSLSTPEGTLGDSVPAFRGIPDLDMRDFNDPSVQEADVVFFATAGGQAKSLVPQLPESTLVIDLSRDHRVAALRTQATLLAGDAAGGTGSASESDAGAWSFGLTESPLAVQKGATRIANPGCYPTSALLGMAPLLQADLLATGALVVDGKSGVSGAGATPRPDLHFTDTNEDVRAYKPVGHDHTEEIRLGARRLDRSGEERPVRFTPHLIPINRGLLTTAYLPLKPGVGEDDLLAAYDTAYGDTTTVRVVDEARIANVRNTARAEVAWTLDRDCQMVVVRSAIDNLLKGGSAQAIQNMNRAFGVQETTGLPLIGGP